MEEKIKPISESEPYSASKKEKEAGGSAVSEQSGKSVRSWLLGSKTRGKARKFQTSKTLKESNTKNVEKKSSVSKHPKAEASGKKANPPGAKKTAAKSTPVEKEPTKKSKQSKRSKSEKKSVLDHESASNSNTKTSEKPDPVGSISSADKNARDEPEPEPDYEPDWLEDDGIVETRNGMDAIEASRNLELAENKSRTTTYKEPAFVAGLRMYHCDTLASTFMTGLTGLAHFGVVTLDEEEKNPSGDEHVIDGWMDEEEPEERFASESRESRRKIARRMLDDDEESDTDEIIERTRTERKQIKKRGDDRSRDRDSRNPNSVVNLMIRRREDEKRVAAAPQDKPESRGSRSRGSRSRSSSRPRALKMEERSLQLDEQEFDEEEEEEELVEHAPAEIEKRELDQQVAKVFVPGPESPKGGMSISTIEIPTPMVLTAQEDDGSVSILGLFKKKRSSRKKEREEDPIEEEEEEEEEDQKVEEIERSLTPPVGIPVRQLKKGKPSFIGKFLGRKRS
jgi:hypothetical protein